MPGQGRLGDKANVPLDSHGCPACPHPVIGPAIQGSPDVKVNGRPALRIDDPGLHAACCGTNTWTAKTGSATVFINGKGAHRMGDQTRHCGGMGQLVEGSPNVIVGESTSSGAGASSHQNGGPGRGGGDAGGDDSRGRGEHPGPSGGATRTGDGGRPASDGIANSDTAGAVAASTSNDSVPTSFIELSLVDQHDQPITGQRYRVTTSDGQMREGLLDSNGRVRIDHIKPGTCKVGFPDLDADDWSLG